MTKYAVTGASGQLGWLAVEALLNRDVAAGDIVAIARSVDKCSDLGERGVNVRYADYSQGATLAPALEGVDRLLLVSSSEVGSRASQHRAVVDAAKQEGVQRIAYTSIVNADRNSSPLAAEHLATEAHILASGLPHSLLRNGWYTENLTYALPQYLATGEIVGAGGAGRISGAARADYADAAAASLIRDSEDAVVYELGGAAFTYVDLAAAVTGVSDTDVSYRDLSLPEYTAHLEAAGLPAETIGFLAMIEELILANLLETDSGALEQLLGRPATPLVDIVHAAYKAL